MARGELIPIVADQAIQLTQASSTSIFPGDGVIVGLIVWSSTNGTLTLTDGNSQTPLPNNNLGASVAVPYAVALNIKFKKGLTPTGGGTFVATLLIAQP